MKPSHLKSLSWRTQSQTAAIISHAGHTTGSWSLLSQCCGDGHYWHSLAVTWVVHKYHRTCRITPSNRVELICHKPQKKSYINIYIYIICFYFICCIFFFLIEINVQLSVWIQWTFFSISTINKQKWLNKPMAVRHRVLLFVCFFQPGSIGIKRQHFH